VPTIPGAPVPPEPVLDLLPDEGVPPPPAPPVMKQVFNDPKANPKLAPWQERLTLGPGDIVNLQVFGRKEYTRGSVPIGPDGTLSYLQVVGFKAAGLTIDELRVGLTKELRKYIQNSQVIVTPAAYRSKKYYLLGTIIDRGAFTLDRPMTLLEAAARARGIATGLMEQNTVEIADMRRAFIVRNGKKLDVNFTKLFYEGDTTQNIPLQPGDYIYFPSTSNNEAYVLGAVGSPGTIGVTENLTALGAITVRGGFTPASWRKKVIVVRGSTDQAKREIIVVDAAAILAGRQTDIFLQARDLVFVSEKPWQQASDILDVALRAFVQTGTATWTGDNIGPLIKEPILPSLQSE
ncbi:MAG: polysaccharide export protein Wza, partial [Verrucomicrobiales bacterium]|nr:polysaccharide export protein Wza [Verrucomicrobiales bacterium]